MLFHHRISPLTFRKSQSSLLRFPPIFNPGVLSTRTRVCNVLQGALHYSNSERFESVPRVSERIVAKNASPAIVRKLVLVLPVNVSAMTSNWYTMQYTRTNHRILHCAAICNDYNWQQLLAFLAFSVCTFDWSFSVPLEFHNVFLFEPQDNSLSVDFELRPIGDIRH